MADPTPPPPPLSQPKPKVPLPASPRVQAVEDRVGRLEGAQVAGVEAIRGDIGKLACMKGAACPTDQKSAAPLEVLGVKIPEGIPKEAWSEKRIAKAISRPGKWVKLLFGYRVRMTDATLEVMKPEQRVEIPFPRKMIVFVLFVMAISGGLMFLPLPYRTVEIVPATPGLGLALPGVQRIYDRESLEWIKAWQRSPLYYRSLDRTDLTGWAAEIVGPRDVDLDDWLSRGEADAESPE